MTNDALTFMGVIISEFWRFLTSWYIPGFFFTPAQFIMFIMIFPLILRTVSDILTVSVSTDVKASKIDDDHYWGQIRKRG